MAPAGRQSPEHAYGQTPERTAPRHGRPLTSGDGTANSRSAPRREAHHHHHRALSTPGINAQLSRARSTPLLPPNSPNDHAIFHQEVTYARPLLLDHDRYPPMPQLRAATFLPARGVRQRWEYNSLSDANMWPHLSEALFHEPEGLRDLLKRKDSTTAAHEKAPVVPRETSTVRATLLDAGRAVREQMVGNGRAVGDRLSRSACALGEKAKAVGREVRSHLLCETKSLPPALEKMPLERPFLGECDFTVLSLHDIRFPSPEILIDRMGRRGAVGDSGALAADPDAAGDLNPDEHYLPRTIADPRRMAPSTNARDDRVHRRRRHPSETLRRRFALASIDEETPSDTSSATPPRLGGFASSMDPLPPPAYPLHATATAGAERDEMQIVRNREAEAERRRAALAAGEEDRWAGGAGGDGVVLAPRFGHREAGVLTLSTATAVGEGSSRTPPILAPQDSAAAGVEGEGEG
ncbi:hypothetical protein M409DRAFT_57423 [Zasmidium cellare ATCC 36951]|uniref:Uncharacterized protein n=1 Tax=Zasmidium cellare ATCC 36951 TaxID=1080233 RepID=A0A6A6C9N3_ZASCE|nr:uncharacterized protein M409DRAFT_57423 [Zasmidium cellare ATCC 36951]KAF2163533.1 hypothetical protein M409DRAFT_57423 [Zasmidium cellare ATCC 36951]